MRMAFMVSAFRQLFDLAYFMAKGSVAYARKKGVKIGENCRIILKIGAQNHFWSQLVIMSRWLQGWNLLPMMAVPVWSKMSKGNAINALPRFKLVRMCLLVWIALLCRAWALAQMWWLVQVRWWRKDIPDHSVAIGVPAKVVSSFAWLSKPKFKATCASDTDLAGITDYRERVERAMAISSLKKLTLIFLPFHKI